LPYFGKNSLQKGVEKGENIERLQYANKYDYAYERGHKSHQFSQ
jgi:hypothetical protein